MEITTIALNIARIVSGRSAIRRRSCGGTGPISCSYRSQPSLPACLPSRPLRGTLWRRAAMQVAAYARVSTWRRPRRRPLSSSSIACVLMPRHVAGVWRRRVSFATMPTAARA